MFNTDHEVKLKCYWGKKYTIYVDYRRKSGFYKTIGKGCPSNVYVRFFFNLRPFFMYVRELCMRQRTFKNNVLIFVVYPLQLADGVLFSLET